MKKIIAIVSAIAMSMSIVAGSATSVSATSGSTGVGMSAHALKAYNENWQYVYGSATTGYVDCSGLICTYNGVGGNRVDMLGSSSEWGYVRNGIPRIHGLGLHQPGHVGVYIGSNTAIDARGTGYNCVMHNPYNKSWVEWFKIAGVAYPNTGWVLFDNKAFYYEDGQYIVDTSRELDGVTYNFDSLGRSDVLPPEDVYTQTDYSNVTINQPTVSYAPQPVSTEGQAQIDAENRAAEQRRVEEKRKEEARKKAEEARKKVEEARKKAEEARKKAEEARKKKEAERKKKEAERKKRRQEAINKRLKFEKSKYCNIGSTGLLVVEYQELLKKYGYYKGEITGYFDESTSQALSDFAKNNKLMAVGIGDEGIYNTLKSTYVETKPITFEPMPGVAIEQKTRLQSDGKIVPIENSFMFINSTITYK